MKLFVWYQCVVGTTFERVLGIETSPTFPKKTNYDSVPDPPEENTVGKRASEQEKEQLCTKHLKEEALAMEPGRLRNELQIAFVFLYFCIFVFLYLFLEQLCPLPWQWSQACLVMISKSQSQLH